MRHFIAFTGIILFLSAPAAAQDSSTDYTEAYQQKALEIYRASIGFHTARTFGQVPKMAAYLAQQFRDGGFPEEDVHLLPFTLADGEETASLVVRYRGDDSSGRKPILLLAHMDVVDALPQDWELDPFTLVEDGGYFFGRGTFDNKMGVTMLATTFLRLKADGFIPSRDLIVAFTGDEETGMQTAHSLVTTHRELTDAEYALNADGGGGELSPGGAAVAYNVQTSEKTYATFELTIRNPGGHSSTPRDDNAIYELATVLKNIESLRFPVRINETTERYFEAYASVTGGKVGEAMGRLASNPDDEDAAEVLAHVPSKVGITRTTCIATMLRAGHAENALPQSATATVNCRIFPGVEIASVKTRLTEAAGNDSMEIKLMGEPTSSPLSPIREDVMAAINAAVESRFPGTPVVPYMAPYATDGKHVRAAGIPTYGVSGLFMKNEDSFAHGLNERVPVSSFYGGLEHWKTILTNLAGR